MRNENDNRELLATEASVFATDIESYPAVMYIESQRGCPYDCIMCTVPKSYGRKPTEMPQEILDRLSPYFKYLEVLAIHGNGEALLSKRMDDYIDIANKNDCFLHCNSTGFPLNRRLSDKLIEAKLDIRFSIHAGSKKTYKRVMNDDLDKVLGKIAYLLDLSRKKGRPENKFWFSCIVMKDNVEELDQFIELAGSVGITEVRFMNLHPNHRTLLGTRRSPDEKKFIHFEQANSSVSARFNELLPELKAKAEELGINIGSGSMNYAATIDASFRDASNKISNKLVGHNIFPLTQASGECLVPWTGQVQVEQNGDIGLCCTVKHIIGNLYKADFAEIWHGKEMDDLRASFRARKQPRVCGYCRGIGTGEYDIPVNRVIDLKRSDSVETHSDPFEATS